MKKLIIVLFLVLGVLFLQIGTASAVETVYSVPGIYEFIAPAGVTEVTVQLWGGGGGGGERDFTLLCTGDGGGGGAGGYVQFTAIVIPGLDYRVQVGSGGTNSGNSGAPGTLGGLSSFGPVGGADYARAEGGRGGQGASCLQHGAGGLGGTVSTFEGAIAPFINNGASGASGGAGGAGGVGFQGIGTGGNGGGFGAAQPGTPGRVIITYDDADVPAVRPEYSPETVSAGNIVTIDMYLDNVQNANGGIDAIELDCTASGPWRGQSVTSSTEIFTPDPVILNDGYDEANAFLYAVSQSGDNPSVTTGGKILTTTLIAEGEGTGQLSCVVTSIDGTGNQANMPGVLLTVPIGAPPPVTGTINGTVHRSHAVDHSIRIRLVNTETGVIRTTQTSNNGSFSFINLAAGPYMITASAPGHLSAETTLNLAISQIVTMPEVTLPAGNLINGPSEEAPVIDELDVVQLALHYGQTVAAGAIFGPNPPPAAVADLTIDLVVGLADLNALARNLRMTGPIAWE